MEHLEGQLFDGQGQVLFTRVAGVLRHGVTFLGLTWWDGRFALAPGERIEPGDYRLLLKDGRAGNIHVGPGNYRSGQRGVIEFSDRGPLQ
ncbi:MAG TPA: hypothetical protein VG013_32815 [Gemmataceae bacterium]|nr:hypothetical protein [Gemmataceae bacterium]